MSYSDIEMIIASQIAYIDFNRTAVDSGQYTIKELMEITRENADADTQGKIDKLMTRINQEAPQCGEWRIRDIRNQQNTSGMYACMLETGNGSALVAFRGSESDNLSNIYKDWIQSDIGLLNSTLTPQQKTAEQYMDYIYKKYGGQYNNFALTGHSLGGNLAEHAAITAPDGMREKITQSVNLDGPGFSNQYLVDHAKEIGLSSAVLTHYRWSWCGHLLNDVPGSYAETMQARTPEEGILWRHDTYSVVKFDENGNMVPGKKDWLAEKTEPLARVLDFSLFFLSSVVEALRNIEQEGFQKFFQNLWEQWNQIRFSVRKQAEFEIHTGIVRREIEAMSALVPQLREISEDVERIQRELAFDSLAAGYVKFKLRNIANSIQMDARKTEGFCSCGRECTAYYISYEKNIAGNYR